MTTPPTMDFFLPRENSIYITDTFRILRMNVQRADGECRAKRVILEVYDAVAQATRTGIPHVIRLEPAPADRRVAHPPRGQA
jgi:hypothetical protein